jgi:predicted ATPase
MNLKFNTNVLAAAEQSLRKPLITILEELESEEGVSLTTLRALVAAGRYGAEYSQVIVARHRLGPRICAFVSTVLV